ncbi:MAG: allantoinase AllB [Candidatus Thorarchaeota archaeon]
MVDLVIKNSKLLLETGMVRGGLAVSDGRICAIATDTHLPDADTIIDVEGKIVMPGVIDAHAHIHDPNMLEHEDFTTGSQAAAAGGVTTFVDMPLTNQVDTVEAVEGKIADGERLSLVDFTFYGGMMNSDNMQVIPALVEKGVSAFKAFTCEPYQTNNGVLTHCLSEISETGGHLTIHSEDQGILDEFKREFKDDWDAPISHSLSRPHLAEQLAIRQNIAIARNTGGHLHIAHVTTQDGLREIESGKLQGVTVTTEVCPHHLMFDRDDMNRLGPKSKMNPPLRSKQDRSALWSGLLRGSVDIVVSDHAPSPIDKKDVGKDDIRRAWAGVDGIQTILNILLSEGVNKGRLTYSRLLKVCSRNPARIFGLYPKKGSLMIGSDADIVVVDPHQEVKVTADMMKSKCGWTIYEGLTLKGVVERTFVRGVEVFAEGEMVGAPGHGKFLPMGCGDRLGGG